MKRTMVRYQVKPEAVAENEARVRAVMAELDVKGTPGVHYAVFKESDGVSFVHMAIEEDDSPGLPSIGAFDDFRRGLPDRVEVPPHAEALEQVAAHGMSWSD